MLTALLALAATAAGCNDAVTSTTADAGGRDAAADAAPLDAEARDAEPADLGVRDAMATDLEPVDVGPPDLGITDAEPADAGFADAEPADLGPPDLGLPDAAPDAAELDAAILDAEVADADVLDAAAPDAEEPDVGPTVLPSGFTRSPLDVRAGPSSAEAIDIDGDGDVDVVAAFAGASEVVLYLNGGDDLGGGDGTSWAPVVLGSNIVAMHTAFGDLDGDGDLDVAAVGLYDPTRPGGSPGEVRWFENPGAAGLAWIEHAFTGFTFYAPRTIRAGDLTGDGLDDLVVGCVEGYDDQGNTHGQGVYWLRNEGGGAFSSPITITTQLGQVETVLVDDLDLDGVLDIVASSTGNGEIVWLENLRSVLYPNPSPGFISHAIVQHSRVHGIALADLDADPHPELFATYDHSGLGAVVWLSAPADPRLRWSEHLIDASFGAGAARLAIADLNGDGRIDLAASADLEVRAYFNDGRGAFLPLTAATSSIAFAFVETADLTGDGAPELLVGTSETPGQDEIDILSTSL